MPECRLRLEAAGCKCSQADKASRCYWLLRLDASVGTMAPAPWVQHQETQHTHFQKTRVNESEQGFYKKKGKVQKKDVCSKAPRLFLQLFREKKNTQKRTD